ncbi:NUDIX domain-containing protein [Candidatus Saccharibacteria bacterium]|nr:MAG: NUDIX domain-containing protein [Candidatus Saccharibacteria bacterium]
MAEYIDKLALLYLKDGKLLYSLTRGKDTWYIPGGKREGSETDLQALKREIKEEMNVELDDTTITYYGTFEAQAHGKPEGVMVRMTCYTAEVIGKIEPTSEIEKLEYHGYADDIPKSPVDYLIIEDLHNKGLLR